MFVAVQKCPRLVNSFGHGKVDFDQSKIRAMVPRRVNQRDSREWAEQINNMTPDIYEMSKLGSVYRYR